MTIVQKNQQLLPAYELEILHISVINKMVYYVDCRPLLVRDLFFNTVTQTQIHSHTQTITHNEHTHTCCCRPEYPCFCWHKSRESTCWSDQADDIHLFVIIILLR